MSAFILAIDQGTTSSRAIVFSEEGLPVASAQIPLPQHFPFPGWVSHDPMEILKTQYRAISEVMEKFGGKVDCIGITNQRETAVVWEKATGKPVCDAIVWQCRRTAPICEQLTERGLTGLIKKRTGLNIDPYFSATKYQWILANIPNGVERAKNGELICGTIDAWLIWNLTGFKVHATDATNASRSMLYHITALRYDDEICTALGIPMQMLPEVRDTAGDFGKVAPNDALPASLAGVPIRAAVGDQQAALFGQQCFNEGEVKNTYGTGCFTLMNLGQKPSFDPSLLTTVAWKLKDRTVYALEGSVFNAGSSIQWLRDNLGIVDEAAECDRLAESVPDNGGVVFVSAFTGLGAPYWDMYARGAVLGLTRGTTRAHLCRAVLEGIANQVCDLVGAMETASGRRIISLRADGGASVSDFLLQYQADMLGIAVDRPAVTETTALGAAYLAGLGVGIWRTREDLRCTRRTEKYFAPIIDNVERARRLSVWREAVQRTMDWSKPQQ